MSIMYLTQESKTKLEQIINKWQSYIEVLVYCLYSGKYLNTIHKPNIPNSEYAKIFIAKKMIYLIATGRLYELENIVYT